MKPQDFMIGDWVYNEYHKKNVRLTAYDFFTHGHDKMTDEQYLLPNSQPTTFRDKTPITLTEEILKENGFVRCGTSQLFKRKDWIYFALGNPSNPSQYYDNYWVNISGVGIHIQYVHELQHALRLCGLNELADNFKLPQYG